MSLGAYPSTSIESWLTKNAILLEHNEIEVSKSEKQEKPIRKMKELQDYHIHVNSLDFRNLKEEELCSLYKNHIKNTKIKLQIESLTDFYWLMSYWDTASSNHGYLEVKISGFEKKYSWFSRRWNKLFIYWKNELLGRFRIFIHCTK